MACVCVCVCVKIKGAAASKDTYEYVTTLTTLNTAG